MTDEWDAVVIGGGAAGLSAAQMLGRSKRRTLVIDAGLPRNRFAARMHGVLGHDGVDPMALLETGRAEARRYGVEFAVGTVAKLSDGGDRMTVTREDGSVDRARAVVIASGIIDHLPDVPGLAGQWGRTVLHCPYCHGWEVAGQRLGVLLMSEASKHQLELVRQLSDDVTAFTASVEPLDDAANSRLAARGVGVVSATVVRVDHRPDGLAVVTDDGEEHLVDALFAGGSPVLNIELADGLDLARVDGPGSALAADLRGGTSHRRVFAAGNVIAPFANVPVSMGSGSMAGAGANGMLAAEDFDIAVSAAISASSAERAARD
ncbi:NAD(P)/FAD-dependent oxidoreductase [Microbacterium sp. NPDC057407]|uniref:NAD(P)/FAD-dependent oxidoreductase n=1 Tax=Microbacterium sp. NPDC057407 TaxID=3346120 RepID=UPI00366EA219